MTPADAARVERLLIEMRKLIERLDGIMRRVEVLTRG